MKRWLPKDAKEARTWILFAGGFSGVVYETIVAQIDRPTLLVIFAAMMGLPLFLKRDDPPPPGPPPLPGVTPEVDSR